MDASEVTVQSLDCTHIHFSIGKLSREFFWFLWVMYAFVYMTKCCYTAAMASIVAEGVLTKAQTGFITAAFYIIYGPLQIVGGIVADKHNPYRLIKLSLLGGALANLVIFFNQNYSVMLGAWCFNAVVQFPLWPATFKVISSQLVKSDRKKNTFYISFGTTAGMFLSYLVAALLSDWRMNFAISAFVLAFFAVAMHFVFRRMEPYMKLDKDAVKYYEEEQRRQQEHQEHHFHMPDHIPGIGTFKLFARSGFFLFCVLAFCRVVVDNGFKTLAPTMIMESYSMSPALSNALGLVVIVAGAVGMVIVRLVYPHFVKNELRMHLLLMVIAIPFSAALQNIAGAGLMGTILSMCAISALFTGMRTLAYNYNMRFVKYGKDGTAAGISNAAESLALTVQSYGFTFIADKVGWSPVMAICLGAVLIGVVLNIFTIYMWRRFKKSEEKRAALAS